MSENSWTLYILQTQSGKFYTGITLDLNRRLQEHFFSKKGAKFFRIDKPKQIIYTEFLPNRSLAQKREAEIKKMTKVQKLSLIYLKQI